MLTKTRVRAAFAGIFAAALALTASPAIAAEGDPSFTVSQDTFTAGSWESGIEVEITGVPEGAETVSAGLGSQGANGVGAVAYVEQDAVAEGGAYTLLLEPPADAPPVAPDSEGYPVYRVSAQYTMPGEEYASSIGEPIELTILPGPVVSGATEATPSELASGVSLFFEGFSSQEALSGSIQHRPASGGDWSEIGTFSNVAIGEDGTGEGTLTVTGASAGDFVRVVFTGNTSDVTVVHYVAVVEGDEPVEPTPEQPVDTPQNQPTKPVRVETAAL